MSILTMTNDEQKNIDSQIEQMMDWAKTRHAEAEQLALDSARLIACTTDRVDRLKNQSFFKRCWYRFTGKSGEMERANTSDIIQMQKKAFRYINMLQEQHILMPASLIISKNSLNMLAVKDEDDREVINDLAQKALEQFQDLDQHAEQLKITSNIQGWLLGLEERDYDEKYPTEYMRMFRVINDFYGLKKDNWNYNDLMFLRKAIRIVGLNPKDKISLNAFVNKLIDEIANEAVGLENYGLAISLISSQEIENYSKFVLDNISSPIFATLHALNNHCIKYFDIIEVFEEENVISRADALRILLMRSIAKMNVSHDYEFTLFEAATEILGSIRILEKLAESHVAKCPVHKKRQRHCTSGSGGSGNMGINVGQIFNNSAFPTTEFYKAVSSVIRGINDKYTY